MKNKDSRACVRVCVTSVFLLYSHAATELTRPLTPAIWVLHTSGNSATLAGCLIFQCSPGAIYVELPSGTTG